MAVKEIQAGQVIYQAGGTVSEMAVILGGQVKVETPLFKYTDSNGALLGVAEQPGGEYEATYTAETNVRLACYQYRSLSDVSKLMQESNPKIRLAICCAVEKTARQAYEGLEKYNDSLENFLDELDSIYNGYKQMCASLNQPCKEIAALEGESSLPSSDEKTWIRNDYFKAMSEMPMNIKNAYISVSPALAAGNILFVHEFLRTVMTMQKQVEGITEEHVAAAITGETNFFAVYSDMVMALAEQKGLDISDLLQGMNRLCDLMSGSPFVDKQAALWPVQKYRSAMNAMRGSDAVKKETVQVTVDDSQIDSELSGALTEILAYSGIEDEKSKKFADLVEQFRALADKSSTEDEARRLRKEMTSLFYEVYEGVILNRIERGNPSMVIRMFLLFGFVDAEIATQEYARELYKMARRIPDEERIARSSERILPFAAWLIRIYLGAEMPSRDEFDNDYPAFLRTARQRGDITKQEEQDLLENRTEMVKFELKNLGVSSNRLTSGRTLTFWPIFYDGAVTGSLGGGFQTPDSINAAFEAVRYVDFSCYYRPVVFADESKGIHQEYIDKEVLPNVIMMPNCGTRAMLWQEISGARRDTKGRMVLSIVCHASIDDVVAKLSGEFRWEMCKRIQGAFWNDISDRSLTSEYCDYLQFYKKNRDLSAEVKDQVKQALARANNQYRNVFVSDYLTWIKFESKGSPRMNRYARNIMFTYCPFPKELREKFRINPMYQDMIEKYSNRQGQKVKRLMTLIQKLEKDGVEVPQVLRDQDEFLRT